MEQKGKTPNATNILITGASFVILVAGMRAAGSILVPFLLSVFIAIICAPPLFWMQRKGIPNVLAVLSILIGIIFLGLLLAAFVGTSLNDFSSAMPVYEKRLSELTAAFISWLRGLGLDVPSQVLRDLFDPAKAMRMAARYPPNTGPQSRSPSMVTVRGRKSVSARATAIRHNIPCRPADLFQINQMRLPASVTRQRES